MLRNASVQLTISKGRITSLVDVKLKYIFLLVFVSPSHTDFYPFSRELIQEGKTGGLVIFQDRPNYWDAWGKDYLFIFYEPYSNFFL